MDVSVLGATKWSVVIFDAVAWLELVLSAPLGHVTSFSGVGANVCVSSVMLEHCCIGYHRIAVFLFFIQHRHMSNKNMAGEQSKTLFFVSIHFRA